MDAADHIRVTTSLGCRYGKMAFYVHHVSPVPHIEGLKSQVGLTLVASGHPNAHLSQAHPRSLDHNRLSTGICHLGRMYLRDTV